MRRNRDSSTFTILPGPPSKIQQIEEVLQQAHTMHKTIISLEVNRYEFHYKGESADLGGKNGDLLWVYLLFAPGGTAVSAINPGNASVPGRPCEHASAAEYLQRDIANSNSNLHSNNIHCIILYYSSIQLIQLWFLTWRVFVAGLLQSAVVVLRSVVSLNHLYT